MEIIETYHFQERLQERSWKTPEKVRTQFIDCMKLIKKKKIHPKKGSSPNTYKIQYEGNRFVFEKNHGKIILVTYAKSNLPY